MTAAYKLTLLLQRREDMSTEEFGEAWLDAERSHPLDASGLVRHRFHRRVSPPEHVSAPGGDRVDAIVETWWTRKNDAADWVVSKYFSVEWARRRQALLAGVPGAMGGTPVTSVALAPVPDGDEPTATVFFLPVARRRLRFDSFVRTWTGEYAELMRSVPGSAEHVIGFEQAPAPVAPPSRFTRTGFDGVEAVTYASQATMEAAFASAHVLVAPRVSGFADPGASALLMTIDTDMF